MTSRRLLFRKLAWISGALTTVGLVAYAARVVLELSGVLTSEQTYGWQILVELPLCCGCIPLGTITTIVFIILTLTERQTPQE